MAAADKSVTNVASPDGTNLDKVVDVTVPDGEIWYVESVRFQTVTANSSLSTGDYRIDGGTVLEGVDPLQGNADFNLSQVLDNIGNFDPAAESITTNEGGGFAVSVGAYLTGGQSFLLAESDDVSSYTYEMAVNANIRRVL